MRRWLFALGLLGCLTAAHAESPVWALHGERNTVYLAGSLHLLRPDDAQLPPMFEQAYEDAETLVMEIDLDDVDPLQTASLMLEQGTLDSGKTLRQIIGEARSLSVPVLNQNRFLALVGHYQR